MDVGPGSQHIGPCHARSRHHPYARTPCPSSGQRENRLAGIISQSDLIRQQGSWRKLGDGDVGAAIRRTTIFVDGDIPMLELRAHA